MRKLWFKLCSLLLVAVLLANMLPLQTFAEQLNTEDMSLVNPGADTSEKETATGKIVEELTDKRTEYTKQFRMDNGLFIAAVYNDPVHYEKDGQWHYECVTFYFRYDGEETRSFLPEITKSVSVKKPESTLVPEAADETVVAVDSEPANEERDAEIIIAEDEDAIIGIIGGADGPTSVTIAGPEGFTDFFGKLFSGVMNGIEEEMVSVQTEPLETEEPAFIIPEEDASETDPYEEMAEVTEETDTAEQAWDASGGMRDFFSGVFGGFGK